MKSLVTKSTAIMTLSVISLTGCVAGNELKVDAHRATTVGQELIDLEKAREKGLLSDSEYSELREEILKGGPLNIDIDSDGHFRK